MASSEEPQTKEFKQAGVVQWSTYSNFLFGGHGRYLSPLFLLSLILTVVNLFIEPVHVNQSVDFSINAGQHVLLK